MVKHHCSFHPQGSQAVLLSQLPKLIFPLPQTPFFDFVTWCQFLWTLEEGEEKHWDRSIFTPGCNQGCLSWSSRPPVTELFHGGLSILKLCWDYIKWVLQLRDLICMLARWSMTFVCVLKQVCFIFKVCPPKTILLLFNVLLVSKQQLCDSLIWFLCRISWK